MKAHEIPKVLHFYLLLFNCSHKFGKWRQTVLNEPFAFGKRQQTVLIEPFAFWKRWVLHKIKHFKTKVCQQSSKNSLVWCGIPRYGSMNI